jgi:hypothetical protein
VGRHGAAVAAAIAAEVGSRSADGTSGAHGNRRPTEAWPWDEVTIASEERTFAPGGGRASGARLQWINTTSERGS